MRWVWVALIVICVGLGAYVMYTMRGGDRVDLSGKRILMIIAPKNFRDEELFIPMEYFQAHGAKVVIASKKAGECVGMLGSRVNAKLSLADVNVSTFDAVVFVGGSGSTVYYSDPEALRIAREAYEQGKVVGAICLAPGILARAGILKGKRATVWWRPGATIGKDALEAGGAILESGPVVVDDHIVTANGPDAALEFAKAIAKLLTGNA